jgi:hypothetical protein
MFRGIQARNEQVTTDLLQHYAFYKLKSVSHADVPLAEIS